jgi:hypothetical protein
MVRGIRIDRGCRVSVELDVRKWVVSRQAAFIFRLISPDGKDWVESHD